MLIIEFERIITDTEIIYLRYINTQDTQDTMELYECRF